MLTRSGPMAMGINQGGIFARARCRESTRPDVQFHFATLSSDMAGSPVHTFSGFTMSVCQLRPDVARHVFESARPTRSQRRRCSPTTCRRRRIGQRSSPASASRDGSPPRARCARTSAGEYRPGAEAATDDDLLEFARNTGGTIFHPSGTTQDGIRRTTRWPSSMRSCACTALRGLRVVDCGVMPTLVSGNTNAPVVMIAEKAADMILAASTS